ncbi:simple sugar transport system ATP-binding protein [Desulfacinum hydrothermale DSM 13146]|uniref:Simple sugar transport system ATP-binding protein n=1 Tax=Desulfacinum hydrothermale DSM 13146 TaxID=1121390 RepID=A0A1W1XVA9_9BACT|nr:ATP-binding cassette domain-containing protein [Desulfacinum hydrothermale]SMC27481.1 simple sugar transport system ATP-binding protein [Desulfacinum hydrothermale DSM 13146]
MHIQLKEIHKFYGPVHANQGIDLTVDSGTIHGILGENGAGKSTLMKILAGYIQKSSGEILLDGQAVEFRNPAMASRMGIGMLYQDPLDFPPLTVLENFMLGQVQGTRLSQAGWGAKLQELAQHFDFQLDPHAPLATLTVGERQQLELLRLLSLGARLLILDEPTTGISPVQKQVLFHALKKLAREGKTVLVVSHKIEDVEALCDRVTILRQGRVTGEMDAPFDSETILAHMFGTPPVAPPKCAKEAGGEVLAFRQVSAQGGRAGLKDCTVSFQRGQVVGLAGLEGSGQGVFLRLAAGLQRPLKGAVFLDGRDMRGADHHEFKRRGVTFLPTARLEEGLIPGLSITEHFALAACRQTFLVPWLDALKEARTRVERFKIRGTPETSVEGLSGGNQQRLLLSLIPPSPKVLLLEQPTRGLDVESAHWMWQHLLGLCDQGTTILFSSAELDEILMVADRVLVFFNGRIVLDVTAAQADPERIGAAIAGRAPDSE